MIILCFGICILIIIFLLIKLSKKQQLDKTQYQLYIQENEQIKASTAAEQQKLQEAEKRLKEANDQYLELMNIRYKELDEYFTNQRNKQQHDLDAEFTSRRAEKEDYYSKLVHDLELDAQNRVKIAETAADSAIQENIIKVNKIQKETNLLEEKFNSLLAPLQQYEKDKQAKLFYTIQIPEDYQSDIEFLLQNVSPKIKHPDIINKLIWSEYVKSNLDDTFKRVGIEAKSGIYKITNINTGKAYIGKSTDIKKRLSDHIKSSIGITTIAHQDIHDAIFKEGLWNWSIECLTYCEKDQLSELEKYYITFFKTQEFGYNKIL